MPHQPTEPLAAGLTRLSAQPDVVASVEAAREALAQVQRHPANRRGWPKTAAAAALRAARASALADGGTAALDPAADRITDPILAGALRVSAALGSLAATFERAPLQALARLHLLAAADVADAAQLGRPQRANTQLIELSDLIVRTAVPGPILAATVQGQLLSLQPFGSADGVVARAAGRLCAIVTGLDPKGLGVPEVAMVRDRSAMDLLAGWAGNSDEGRTAWLTAYCRWLADGAREATSIADAALG